MRLPYLVTNLSLLYLSLLFGLTLLISNLYFTYVSLALAFPTSALTLPLTTQILLLSVLGLAFLAFCTYAFNQGAGRLICCRGMPDSQNQS